MTGSPATRPGATRRNSRSCFVNVFSGATIRVAYGAAFATPVPVDDDAFAAGLGEMAVRYLLVDVGR